MIFSFVGSMSDAIGGMWEMELPPHRIPVVNCRSIKIGARKRHCLCLESLLLTSVASKPRGSVDTP